MNAAEKARINKDISKLAITNEFSKNKVGIDEGKEIKSFYVMTILIKDKGFDEKNIIKIAKLIPQNLLIVLEHEDEVKLAVYHSKLLQTDWLPKADCSIEIRGLNLDVVWESIIAQIGNIELTSGTSLEEQLARKEKAERLKKEIAKLETQAWAEKQPKKKFEISDMIKKLKSEVSKL